jgi:protein-tyrosine-phosphatase
MRVLFLCNGNSARSQMAEAIVRHASGGVIEVFSAGTEPQAEIHPMARVAIRSLFNIEMTGQAPKSVDQFAGERFDYVFTVCDQAAQACPTFAGTPERIHWNFPDPVAVDGTDEERQQAFSTTASQLLTRIRLWLSLRDVARRVNGPA